MLHIRDNIYSKGEGEETLQQILAETKETDRRGGGGGAGWQPHRASLECGGGVRTVLQGLFTMWGKGGWVPPTLQEQPSWDPLNQCVLPDCSLEGRR